MAQRTAIEWTQSSWNPITGCTKISEGCRNCYAEKMAIRLKAMGQKNYAKGFDLVIHETAFDLPLRWKKPQMIFVNSMSDLFHESVPLKVIKKLFGIMNDCAQHTFQILTKRSHLLALYAIELVWTRNIWMGVTVESKNHIDRIDDLRETPAHVKFISFEPLLSSINTLDISGIDWVIAGGESGPGARPMEESWIIDIRDKCSYRNIPFFFKQWGGTRKKKAGRILHGIEWNEMPQLSAMAR